MICSFDQQPRKPSNKAPPPEHTSTPKFYVVRLPASSKRFAWETQRLGAIMIERSRGDFVTADEAREHGALALAILNSTRR